MNLKKFVKQTMKELDEAIQESPSVIGIRGTIHFDVAVVANENLGVEGGVQVVGFVKGNTNANISNQTTTRLQFDIQTKMAINPSQASPYNPKKNKLELNL